MHRGRLQTAAVLHTPLGNGLVTWWTSGSVATCCARWPRVSLPVKFYGLENDGDDVQVVSSSSPWPSTVLIGLAESVYAGPLPSEVMPTGDAEPQAVIGPPAASIAEPPTVPVPSAAADAAQPPATKKISRALEAAAKSVENNVEWDFLLFLFSFLSLY